MSRPLTVLGMDSEGCIVWTHHPDEPGREIAESESDLIELMGAISRDYLPLWPQSPCAVCGRDAVVTIEGRDLCEGDAMAFDTAEAESEGER